MIDSFSSKMVIWQWILQPGESIWWRWEYLRWRKSMHKV